MSPENIHNLDKEDNTKAAIPSFGTAKGGFLILHAGCCHHDGDWNWQDVRSPFARIYYVSEGTAQVAMPDGIKTLLPHHLYLIPAHTMHCDICTSIFSHYYVHIYEAPDNTASIFDELDLPFEVKAQPTDLQLMERLVNLNTQISLPQSDPSSYDNHDTLLSYLQQGISQPLSERMESQGILQILMSRFLKHATPKNHIQDSRIHKALTYIRQHMNTNIDIATLAEMSYMSKDHFIRVFHQQMGATPNAYIVRKKMEAAELQLITSNVPVKQISLSLGYDDHSYFAKLFKKHTSLTPLQYRTTHKTN